MAERLNERRVGEFIRFSDFSYLHKRSSLTPLFSPVIRVIHIRWKARMEKTLENFDLEYDEDGGEPVVTITLATDRHDAIPRNPKSRRAARNEIREHQGSLQNSRDDPDFQQEQTTVEDIRPARRGRLHNWGVVWRRERRVKEVVVSTWKRVTLLGSPYLGFRRPT